MRRAFGLPDYSAGRCCSNPPLKVKLQIPCKTKVQRISTLDFFGGRGLLANRASEKAPQGLFPPPDYSAGRCCSNPPLKAKLQILCKKSPAYLYTGFFGGRGFLASRASEKAPQGLFPPPDYSAGRCCSNPPLKSKLQILCKTKIQCISTLDFLVGAGGFEPPKLKAADLQSVPIGHSGTRPDSFVCRPCRTTCLF